jgi:hypothetical protein
MSRRVLARPLAAATLAGALVLTPALATADPGNGKGGGQEQAPGQQKDKAEKDKVQKDKVETGKGGGKTEAPGQQKDKGGQGGGKAEAPGQQKEPGQPATGKGQDKGQGNGNGQGPQTGTSGAGSNGNGNGNGGKGGDNGDPAGNNGTVKIAELGEMDGIPNNSPHPGCTFQVEWYGFDEGEDIVSTVTFAAQAPTSDVVIGGTEPSQVPVGGDAASGAGTETGLDAVQAYTLTFDGEPHPKQGYHVKLTVATPGSIGNDTKTKVFWVAPCDEETTTGGVGGTTEDECTDEMTDDSTEGECATDEECTEDMSGDTEGEATEGECVTGTSAGDDEDQGVLGTQLSASDSETGAAAAGTSGEGAEVPTNIDAGADGPLDALTDSPWPLVALLGGLLAALGAVVVRRRAGA